MFSCFLSETRACQSQETTLGPPGLVASSPFHFGRGDWEVAVVQVTELTPRRQIKVTGLSTLLAGLASYLTL